MRQLTKKSFNLKQNQDNQEYLELAYNEATKKSPGDDSNEMNEQSIILSQPGKRRCPVASYKLYVSKLTKIDAFFQKPNTQYKRLGDAWYYRSPVGENTIGKFLSEISKNSGLSITYTNHSIRGMTATAMHCSCYSFMKLQVLQGTRT